MKETWILIGIYLLFLTLSFLLRKVILKVNPKWLMLIIPAYLVSIYFYFDLVVRAHQFLREEGIYMAFGHSSLLLIELCVFAYISALVMLMNVFYLRYKSSYA